MTYRCDFNNFVNGVWKLFDKNWEHWNFKGSVQEHKFKKAFLSIYAIKFKNST
ncbi:hypothetical protein [Spiroplasma ixodetis]|uniref:hypothetical protein n=1 Tax=Spiroplasma ixodetis TaxID=2141 RepID=UPI002577AFB8|nr:hypothetical protein [Spiroplasma ixodetis]WJG70424.1 hypothetical protein SIXOD_v1c15740 [Spiroplasma ixodetis Y32]